ncbi:MAG: hypothetical protein KatS3mg068_0096 [Candidatus Sericytochromatia bacterium]|nr:MAG: hypothetical protein KatS3mg068_0096 [Candidatus Sericytochromatia bacterium]
MYYNMYINFFNLIMLDDYPIKIEIPIAWGDMDPFNHVNNIFYFKYFESSRIKYFEKNKLFLIL